MKHQLLLKSILLLSLCHFAMVLYSQPPQGINYQGAARDNAGEILANQNISVRFSVRNGSPGGTILYQETHSAVTNEFGHFNTVVGQGIVISGTFSLIPWGTSSAKYLQVELDPTGGTSYISMGTQQLLTVPYAFYAAGSGGNWSLGGNSNTTTTNFIGTNDFKPLNFKVDDEKAGLISLPGTENTFFGYQSGNVSTGLFNTAFGYQSLLSNTTGQLNTALGHSALKNSTTGVLNVAIGHQSLSTNINGSENVAIGINSLQKNTAGSDNVAIGIRSMEENINGLFNVGIGREALQKNTTGQGNTAVGDRSLSNTTGLYNTAVGFIAMFDNTSGTSNTAIGTGSLGNNITGGNNTAAGSNSLSGNLSGFANTGVGEDALKLNETGSSNTAIGYRADVSSSNLTNATAIGANASVGASNSVVIGNNANVGIGTSIPTQKLDVNGTMKLGALGTQITNVFRANGTTTGLTINANSSQSMFFPVTNVQTFSSVMVSPGFTLSAGLIIAYARVSSAGNVEVSFRNTTGSTLNISSGQNMYITVIQ